MTIAELVMEINYLERQMSLYEEKYGVLSEDFYAALMRGELAPYDEFDETRHDFINWKGLYETWQRRKAAYSVQIRSTKLADNFRFQPAY